MFKRVRRIMPPRRPETHAADLVAMRDCPDSSQFLKNPTLVVKGEHDTIGEPSAGRGKDRIIQSS